MSNPPSYPPTMNYAGQRPGEGDKSLAITSLVLGIVAFPICCIPYAGVFVSIALGIGAIVTGVMARRRVREGRGAGDGMALAGIILGAIATLLYLILLIIGLVIGANFENIQEWVREQEARQQAEEAEGEVVDDGESIDMADDVADEPPETPEE